MVMSLENLNCDLFQIDIDFNENQFDRKKFYLDITKNDKEIDRELGFFVYHYGAKNTGNEEHAHLVLDLDKKDSSLRLSFHKGKHEVEDVREPYLENVTNWLGSFFKKGEVLEAKINAIFYYSAKNFNPTLQLGFRVQNNDELLKDVIVSGYQMRFPEDSEVDMMMVSVNEKFTLAMLHAHTTTDLISLDIYSEIKRFSAYATLFVEGNVKNVKRRTTRKTKRVSRKP